MRILVTGNLGYIGPCVTRHLRAARPEAEITGLDAGYFADCLLDPRAVPEAAPDRQWLGDVRDADENALAGVDSVVHLAGISNDPIGNAFEAVTEAVNCDATLRLAERARQAGARRFVFASSCSVYGCAEDGARSEASAVNPLTAYARSKRRAELGLAELASKDFVVTCLRFATACGLSPRLRLDLVLNDFVAGALARREVRILSDGTPWRPLIHVADMARAIEWAVAREAGNGGAFAAVNAGSDEWNWQVRDLADAVARAIPGTSVSVNPDAQPDRRSYRVSFELFRRLAPRHQPRVDLTEAIVGLRDGLAAAGGAAPAFPAARFIRLKKLVELRESGRLGADLKWRRAVPVGAVA